MKLSQLFVKTQKNFPAKEVSVNARLLQKAGFVDKLMAGVYTLLPLGFKVVKKIENIIREEMQNLGAQEILMPALHPQSNWEKTNRWQTMDDLYILSDKKGKKLALGPTHEEIVVPLVQKFATSYKDFPLAVFQIQTKFRDETRAKSGLLRGKEFIMKDLYSFHLTEKDLDDYYEKVKEAYFRIFEKVGLKEKTFLTFASGGTFSKFSHEFQTISQAGEDIIYICENCHQAINKEIKNEIKNCPNCQGNKFSQEKSIEVGNIFKLKDKYTKPFNYFVKDRNGQNLPVLMGCYGIGIQRLMGTVVENYHDDKGIIWPTTIAPFQIHLIDIENTYKKTEKLYKTFSEKGFEVLWDDREESAGTKFMDADLLGIPLRVLTSKKLEKENKVEIKIRKSGKIKIVQEKEVLGFVEDVLKTLSN